VLNKYGLKLNSAGLLLPNLSDAANI